MNPPIYRIQLKNGIRLLVIENPVADIISAQFFWRGGASAVGAAQAGLANLTASVLTKGTTSRNAEKIAEEVESMGALLGAECAPDYLSLHLKSIAGDFAHLFHLASDIIRNPTFPQSEVDREQQLVVQSIRSQQERPFSVAFAPLRKTLFGEHPYGYSLAGTTESVTAMTQGDLREFHCNCLRPEQLTLAICGRISPTAAEQLVKDALGDWIAPIPAHPPHLPEFPTLVGANTLRNQQPTQQTIIIIGFRAPSVYSTDWVALKLLAVHLGGGLSSRLFVQLREKQGLAYEVSASYSPRRYAGPFTAYIGTAPDTAEQALAGLQQEITRLLDKPLTEDELQLAKGKILGQYALSKQTNGQLAQLLGWYESLELGIECDRLYPELIQNLDAFELQQVAERHLCIPTVSVAGPD